MATAAGYDARRERLVAGLAEARRTGAGVRLRKDTSNLFRPRKRARPGAIDVRGFAHILGIDVERRTADVEGMVTYESLVRATLAHGLIPAVVPQLKTITVGGAVSGLGIESTSFRHGLVHETVESMDVLVSDGRTLHCSRRENRDLFEAFPNSYGTLGYALRLTLKLIPAARFVRLVHTRFSDPAKFFGHLAASRSDFLDGVIFGPNEMFATEGSLVDDAPRTSDYRYMKIYYQSIRRLSTDWMTTENYLWRWDTDWFWCSKQFHVQNPLVRWMARPWLNSRTYHRWMRWGHRLLPDRGRTESVIQDVQIPAEKAQTFFRFLLSEVPIAPVWVCPFRTFAEPWTLCPLRPEHRYVNFGFWDVLPSPSGESYNRKIERKLLELEGTKALYSTSCYDRETFWRIYRGERYAALKRRFDPERAFPDLYQKATQSL